MKVSVLTKFGSTNPDAIFFTAFEGHDPLGSLWIYMATLAYFSCAVLYFMAEITYKHKSDEL